MAEVLHGRFGGTCSLVTKNAQTIPGVALGEGRTLLEDGIASLVFGFAQVMDCLEVDPHLR
jgi:hypothetical protein